MITAFLLLLSMPLLVYVILHAIAVVFSIYNNYQRHTQKTLGLSVRKEKIAILYTTADDFHADACKTLLQQRDIDFDLFILDDSRQQANQDLIDHWAQQQANRVTVVRRGNKVGFKSGNLNNWLSHYGNPNDYPFILLADADEHWPPDFAQRLLSFLLANPRYTFAQASHVGTAALETSFQKLLHPQIESDQVYILPAWNFLSGVPMIGHGVLIATAAIKQLGGFPNAVSEDLAFTIRLAEHGHVGVIASHIIAFEVFPKSYAAYWKRRYRWIQADTEIVRTFFRQLWHPQLPFNFRLALSLRELRLPLASLHWLLMTTVALISLFFVMPTITLPPLIWVVFLPLLLSPALAILLSPRLRLHQRLLYILNSAFVGAATSVIHVPAVLSSFLGRREFSPTGSTQQSSLITYPPLILWEVGSGLLFIVAGIMSTNFMLAAMGLAVLWSPLLRIFRAESLLQVGMSVFWITIIVQIISTLLSGILPIEQLLVLAGITISLSG